jgi:EpsI family protein
MANRPYLSIVILLLITVPISWKYYFYTERRQDIVSVKDFPRTIDDWTSQELPIDPADSAVLETKNAFLRRYTAGGGKHVYLYVAYSRSNPKASNPPEFFYNGSDISIIDKGSKYIIIASSNLSFKVNWMLLDNDQNQQIAYYWFKVGDVYTRSYWKDQVLAALNNISGRKSGNALIRISTDIVKGRQNQAENVLNEFACLIIPQLFKNLP